MLLSDRGETPQDRKEKDMEKFVVLNSNCGYANHGIAKEQDVRYTLLGYVEKHDNVPFDKGSDIEPLKMSVKSARFTLASKLNGETFEEMLDDFFSRVASLKFTYVTKDNEGYVMDKEEFREFLEQFTTIQTASKKNGGGKVVRAKSESKAMLAWLERASA